jgi:uncharacterized caspase-like protein
MRSFRFVWSLVGVAAAGLLSVGAKRGSSGICDALCGGKLFVIVVGVNNDGGMWHATTAESDTKLLAARLSHRADNRTRIDSLIRAGNADEVAVLRSAAAALGNPADTISPMQMAVLAGPRATLPEIRSAFEAVVRKARAKDTFIFFFGGVSRSAKSPDGHEHYLAVGGMTNFLDDAELRQKGVSGPQLRQWLDNIAASQQLILLEAGDMREFLPEFVASIVDSRPTVAQLSKRNRIVVAPRVYGREGHYGPQETSAGALAYAISSMDPPIVDLFWEAEATERALRLQTAPIGGDYLRVFYERDFLDLYSRIAAGRNQTRGVGDDPPPRDTTPKQHGRHVALLVASDTYDASRLWAPLPNPVRDARAIAEELALNFGFDTTLLVNPSLDQIFAELLELKKLTYGKQDELLIFFAGHGLYNEPMKMGYLVARNSKPLEDDKFLNQSYLPHNMLENLVSGIETEHTLLVLDACFGGTFSDPLKGAGSRGDQYEDVDRNTLIDRKLKLRSRVYLTSGGKEYVPDGRPGAHSPFARKFLEALREASSTNHILTMARLRASVEGLKPEPRSGEFGNNEPGGDFLFIPTATGKSAIAR